MLIQCRFGSDFWFNYYHWNSHKYAKRARRVAACCVVVCSCSSRIRRPRFSPTRRTIYIGIRPLAIRNCVLLRWAGNGGEATIAHRVSRVGCHVTSHDTRRGCGSCPPPPPPASLPLCAGSLIVAISTPPHMAREYKRGTSTCACHTKQFGIDSMDRW